MELKDLLSKQDIVYEIEKIVEMRRVPGKQKYQLLVQWMGLSELENSSEEFGSFFAQVPLLVLDFLRNEPGVDVKEVMRIYGKQVKLEAKKRKLSAADYPFL